MAVDYDEGRRLLAEKKAAEKAFDTAEAPSDEQYNELNAAQGAFNNWLRWHAEALLNPDPWRPISEAPKGQWLPCRRPSLKHPSGFWVAMLIYEDGHWLDINGDAFEPHHYLPTSAN